MRYRSGDSESLHFRLILPDDEIDKGGGALYLHFRAYAGFDVVPTVQAVLPNQVKKLDRLKPIEHDNLREASEIHLFAYGGIYFLAAVARRQHCRDERASDVPATSVEIPPSGWMFTGGVNEERRGTIRGLL